MTKDEALKLALEALEILTDGYDGTEVGVEIEAITALRQALNQLPDATKMIDTGIDRGAWSDVPDATKWVDELRGDEDLDAPPNSTTDVVEPVAWVLLDLWKTGQHWPDDCFNSEGGEGMTPLYTAPIKRKGGQYAKECEAEVQRLKEIIDELENDDSPPKREWVGLTDEEILEAAGIDGADTWVFETAYAIEAKLKEKNRD